MPHHNLNPENNESPSPSNPPSVESESFTIPHHSPYHGTMPRGSCPTVTGLDASPQTHRLDITFIAGHNGKDRLCLSSILLAACGPRGPERVWNPSKNVTTTRGPWTCSSMTVRQSMTVSHNILACVRVCLKAMNSYATRIFHAPSVPV